MKVVYSIVLCVIAMVIFVGCRSSEEIRKNRIADAWIARMNAAQRDIDANRTLTLVDCIQMAWEWNLDYQVEELRERILNEQVTASALGMLPDLIVSNDYRVRSNMPGSSSQNILTGSQTYAYSRSSDENENDFKVEFALSLLDFGLAFFNTVQAHDRQMIAKEQRRRAQQNLTLEVVRAYFKVAATQDAIDQTEELLKRCDGLLDTFKQLAESSAVDRMMVLDERKRFYNLMQRLTEYRRNYNNSCIELRALMGLRPGSKIMVDTSALKEFKSVTLPAPEDLEKIALVERPELYQLDTQSNITTTECYKTILMMIPSVRATADLTNSNNPFLYNQTWWEVAVRSAYNLMKLPQQVAELRAKNSEAEEIKLRRLALSVGIMAQVRMAHANILDVEDRYRLQENIYLTHKESLETARAKSEGSGTLSRLVLDRMEMETVEAMISRTLAMSNYYVAYYRLLNTVGLEEISEATLNEILEEIKQQESVLAGVEVDADRMKREQALMRDNVMKYNGIEIHNNTIAPNSSLRNQLDLLFEQENIKSREVQTN
ncbi:MAG: TolC family protein [Lentisphaeria bacterium]|nr:TolC family protein [Lentisphaeria bacterium]